MSQGYEARRLAFGDSLRQLRERADLSGKQLAELLSWPASKVSRIENAKQQVADSDVVAWCQGTRSPESATALRTELREIRLEAAAWRRQLRTGHEARQRYSQQIEGRASQIRMFEPALVPGLLQTAEYARAVLTAHADLIGSTPDTDEAVRARMRRQDVLFDSTKQLEALISEAALRNPICPPRAMQAQIDRLLSLDGAATLRLGIIPLDRQLPHTLLHGFFVIDDMVITETLHTEMTLTDPDDLAIYNRYLDRLWKVAAEGEHARGILARISSQLQSE